MPPALEAWSLNHWTAREVTLAYFILSINGVCMSTPVSQFILPFSSLGVHMFVLYIRVSTSEQIRVLTIIMVTVLALIALGISLIHKAPLHTAIFGSSAFPTLLRITATFQRPELASCPRSCFENCPRVVIVFNHSSHHYPIPIGPPSRMCSSHQKKSRFPKGSGQRCHSASVLLRQFGYRNGVSHLRAFPILTDLDREKLKTSFEKNKWNPMHVVHPSWLRATSSFWEST